MSEIKSRNRYIKNMIQLTTLIFLLTNIFSISILKKENEKKNFLSSLSLIEKAKSTNTNLKTKTENLVKNKKKLLEQISENDFFDFNKENVYEKIKPFSNPAGIRRFNLDEERTKCMDGSRYGIYYTPGYDKGINNLLIGFEGNGFCFGRKENFDPKSCKDRTNHYWGSSKTWKDEYIYDDNFYGGDENRNKQFFNWNKFIIPYCDGTGNQGYKSDEIDADGIHLFFKGFENTLESFKFIFSQVDINKIDTVVVFGCSSGGWAAFQWMHLLENYLSIKKSPGKVIGILTGGFFIDYKNNFTKDHDFLLKIMEMYDFSDKESPPINKECLKDHKYKDKPYLCLMPEVLMDYVKSPILLFQSTYDSWQIWEILGEKCVDSYKSLKFCNENSKKDIFEMKNYTMNLLKNALLKKKNLSIFSPACVFHCFEFSQRSTNELSVNGRIIDSVLSEFIDTKGEEQIILIDNFDWPNNKNCARN
jgi:hypothetical protein